MPGPDAEEDLAGGNVGGARRRGDVVVRPGGPWSPTVQALLAHLVASGLTGVPEPRGIDPDGSDLTEYLEGTVPTYPMPPWVWAERNLIGAARWLRQFHDTSVAFPAQDASWRTPPREPDDVICHNDFAPYNFVYRGGVMCGVIDWDLAAPGPRVWDLAYLAYRLVPLAGPDNADVPPTGIHRRRTRVGLLCESYGDLSPEQVLAVVPERLDELARVTEQMARDGNAAVAGHGASYRADADWVRTHGAELA